MRPPASYGAGLRPILRILLVPLCCGVLVTTVLASRDTGDDTPPIGDAGQASVEALPTPSLPLDITGFTAPVTPPEGKGEEGEQGDEPPADDVVPTFEEEEPPAPEVPSDDAHTARVNTCLSDAAEEGVYRSVPCRAGTYRLLGRYAAGASGASCRDAGEMALTYSDQLLCLRYEYLATAAYAEVGNCVYGRPDGDSWSLQTCSTGTFRVIGRYYTTDTEVCPDGPILGFWYHTGREQVANVVLCYEAVMPDHGYLVQAGECVSVEQLASGATLIHRAGCPSANGVVTGRFSYGQEEKCGERDGYVPYRFPGWPELSYVVCWRYG
ncbi:hypothetical protein AB0O01_07210 [Streptomyces sp. NPDC093252]|uniref:hypothetical protein n=1 Tax=Streptomyces sp. NPDC093252 TaxID=3154980 RepID=UPI00342D1110